ncbi:unnamed protein product [Protopolystoma xenopodis]|uniref:Uncharacterized protein n=1 Tax=Protopolystoma xenopodis TaxID=117903 RepID=A0A3S5BW16_9PLAT|nr:unnamed protein product [Protopolystoma xenopodis]
MPKLPNYCECSELAPPSFEEAMRPQAEARPVRQTHSLPSSPVTPRRHGPAALPSWTPPPPPISPGFRRVPLSVPPVGHRQLAPQPPPTLSPVSESALFEPARRLLHQSAHLRRRPITPPPSMPTRREQNSPTDSPKANANANANADAALAAPMILRRIPSYHLSTTTSSTECTGPEDREDSGTSAFSDADSTGFGLSAEFDGSGSRELDASKWTDDS